MSRQFETNTNCLSDYSSSSGARIYQHQDYMILSSHLIQTHRLSDITIRIFSKFSSEQIVNRKHYSCIITMGHYCNYPTSPATACLDSGRMNKHINFYMINHIIYLKAIVLLFRCSHHHHYHCRFCDICLLYAIITE